MPDDLKPVLARQMEVYAGFLEHTDHHIGRLIDALEELEILDDTLVYYIVGDNGASAEGTPQGCFNELIILNGAGGLETTEFMASKIDEFGTPEAYNHYAVGWAHAMDTPYQWTKQVASHWGGTRNGTIVHWPAGIKAKGEVRAQFSHVIDVAATVLDAAGIPAPTFVHGVQQMPLHGRSMVPSFDDADAPEHRETQYFEMFVNRGIYHKGWTAVTRHSIPWAATEMPAYDDDVWELYAPDDWTQAHDLAAEQPERLARAAAAVPDRGGALRRAAARRPPLRALQPRPGRPPAADPGHVADAVRGHGQALRELGPGASRTSRTRSPPRSRCPRAARTGVIVAQGGAFGGWTPLPARGPAGLLLQHVRRSSGSRSTAPTRCRRASTRCGWSSPTTAAGSARAATSRSSSTATRSATGRVEMTVPMVFSADETTDVGSDSAHPGQRRPRPRRDRVHRRRSTGSRSTSTRPPRTSTT